MVWTQKTRGGVYPKLAFWEDFCLPRFILRVWGLWIEEWFGSGWEWPPSVMSITCQSHVNVMGPITSGTANPGRLLVWILSQSLLTLTTLFYRKDAVKYSNGDYSGRTQQSWPISLDPFQFDPEKITALWPVFLPTCLFSEKRSDWPEMFPLLLITAKTLLE